MKTNEEKYQRVKKNQRFWLILLAAVIVLAVAFLLFTQISNTNETDTNTTQNEIIEPTVAFNADSAYVFCSDQCNFGPRIMNSEAHDACAAYIIERFKSYDLNVIEQNATVIGYDGTQLKAKNIIASLNPQLTNRILLCAHWDSRPWADNDPDEANHKTPVMAANDGASGVAVMLELARLAASDSTLFANVGIDFICFDAEDWGTPQWADTGDDTDSWALGAQYWAANPHVEGYKADFGILLDMVGGKGARFYREGFSEHYASHIVDKVWGAASAAGYGNYFINASGGMITDDHGPINEYLHIPTIDIIPYYPECQASNFGPTWHTVSDTMENIDREVLAAVGNTLIAVLTAN